MPRGQALPEAPSRPVSSQTGGPRNVVFIGETGSGKSSVINLILGQPSGPAEVSPDAAPCTTHFAPYDVTIHGKKYRLWDTRGLNEPSVLDKMLGRQTVAARSVRQFLREKQREGGLHLLVFCFKGNRASNAMKKAYDGFCRPTRRFAGPVVIAVTHLEKQQPTMDTWWQYNERRLEELGLVFDGHACLTCVPRHHRGWASRGEIHNLISTEYPSKADWSVPSAQYLANDNNCVIC